MLVIIAGFITFLFMFLPYFFIYHSIKTLARVSFLVVLFLLLPHLLFHHEFFVIEMMEKEIFSLEDCLSLATIALFPLAIKSTILLHRHEIRLFYYIRNISLFLCVSLVKTFIRVFFLSMKLIDCIVFYH